MPEFRRCACGCAVAMMAMLASAAAGDTIRVDHESTTNGPGTTGWSDAWTNLQDALEYAAFSEGPHEIWVADGVYYPTARTDSNDPRSVTFTLLQDVWIFGGFQGLSRSGGGETLRSQRAPETYQTVLSGDIGVADDPDDNAYHIITASGEAITNSARLNGFRISHGNITEGNSGFGGGIQIKDGAWPVIARCTFTHHIGAAAGVYGSSDEPSRFLACTFHDNFSGYHGGSIFVDSQASCFLANCLGLENSVANSGAFLFSSGASTSLVNCTIVNNESNVGSSNSATAVRFIGTGAHVVANCVIWGNTNGDGSNETAQIESSASVDVRKSLIEHLDDWAGNGNLGVDPGFVDAPNGDFRVSYLSLIVNYGDDADVPADFYDIDDDSDFSEKLPDRDMNDRINSRGCLELGAFAELTAASCIGDITSQFGTGPDGVVNSYDKNLLLEYWGVPGGVADITPGTCGDRLVNTDDLVVLLGAWGSCSSFSEGGGGLTLEEAVVELLNSVSEKPELEDLVTHLIAYVLQNGL